MFFFLLFCPILLKRVKLLLVYSANNLPLCNRFVIVEITINILFCNCFTSNFIIIYNTKISTETHVMSL